MKIVCDACSAKYSIADEKVRGKVFKIRCKKCSNIIVVRGTAEDADQPQAGFDNKETHVFDYPDDGGHGPTVEGAADEPIWYLVIDQDQAGPMTPAQVRDLFARGEIDVETFAWREGFPDWERLGSVQEFRDLDVDSEEATSAEAPVAAVAAAGAAGAAAEDPGAGMFGGPALEDSTAAQADPADLFAAQTGAGDTPGGGAAEGPMAASGAGEELFSGGGTDGGASAQPVEVASSLTGQRNENSVLFSLNNLASLAGGGGGGGGGGAGGAQPSPSSSPAGPSSSQPQSTGGSEGSGLIDIRSMASVYLGDEDQAQSTKSSPGDDLPVFGTGGFEQASPVLLPPTQSGSSNNKLLYILIGIIGALVIAATVLVIIVVNSGDGDGGQQQMAAAPSGGEDSDPTADLDPTAEEPPADDPVGGEPAAGEGSSGGDEPAPEGDSAADDGAGDGDKAAAANEDDGDDQADRSARARRERARRERAKRRERERERSRRASSSDPDPSPKPKSSGGGGSSGGCDEVSCLVDPSKACCRKYRSGSSGGGGGGSSRSDLPERLSKSDIRSGIRRVRSRVTSCGDKYNVSGTVRVRIKIGSNGRVRGARVNGASGSGARCISSAIKRARFKKSQNGMTVTYPFVFR